MHGDAAWRVSRIDLEAIARRARTLDERLAAATSGDAARTRQASTPWSGSTAFEQWNRAFAAGDREAFCRRLAWDGLREETVRAALGGDGSDTPPDSSASLPAWTHTLAALVRGLPATASDLFGDQQPPETASVDRGTLPPFAEVWIPFVRHARAEFETRAGVAGGRLAPAATTPLEGHLLGQLGELGALALFDEFAKFRERGGGTTAPPSSRVAYRAFVSGLLAGEVVRLFLTYATLARQVVRFVETWIAGTVEFARRLDADFAALGATFASGRDPGPVQRVEAGLSDRHNDGRRVLAVTFADGLRVVYKPRDIALEARFNDLLSWLGQRGVEAPRALRAVPRENYGWVEFVAQAPARDAATVEAYYRRAGALLAVTHLLGGRDLHMDNVVAGEDGPFLVDAETLLQPVRATAGDDGAPRSGAERAAREVGASFLSTGLLTVEHREADGTACEVGGLCGRGGFGPGVERPCWLDANTDAMRPGRSVQRRLPARNELRLDREVEPPERHVCAMAAGFAAAYRFLLARRDEVLAPGGPLAAFAGTRSRVILRPTSVYANLLVRLATPPYQRSGLPGSLLIDALNRVFRDAAQRPTLWPLVAEERRALEGMDVPHFTVATDQTAITAANGERIVAFLAVSGLAAARDRVRRLCERDLERQLDLLRAALDHVPASSFGHETGSPTVATGDGRGAGGGAAERARDGRASGPLDVDAVLPVVVSLAEEIRRRALVGDDGSVSWVVPASLRQEGREDYGVAFYLYHGLSGIALFLAALSRVGGGPAWGDLARGALRSIEVALDGDGQQGLRHEGIGACSGLGGVIYALVTVAGLLDDEWCAHLATRLAATVTAEVIAADRRLDVEGGAAGAALGLLALHARTGSPWVLERAASCGARLVDAQVACEGGGAGWPNAQGDILTGFAHGTAGIAYALTRLASRSGDGSFAAAARRAWSFERASYSPAARTWPVPARDAKGAVVQVVVDTWCHGAPGIAMARALAVAAGGGDGMEEDIETAIQVTSRIGLLDSDHMCCGNMGLIEIMLTLGEVLGRPALVGAARGRARAVLARARGDGGFHLGSEISGRRVFQPGYFRGSAGVGYGLLRLAHPEVLPSVLAFQPSGGAGS